ncbi:MAG: hypothetical protein LBS15_00185 [Endomicrobium sp.]|jgi:hypothetical protein|nr:hypothetical protein [Endomicrobium sp.]
MLSFLEKGEKLKGNTIISGKVKKEESTAIDLKIDALILNKYIKQIY